MYLQGADGKTAYERLFGKKIREEHLEFGEVVLWRKPRGQDYNVIRWESGVWVGVSIYVLMTFGGLVVRQGAADVH